MFGVADERLGADGVAQAADGAALEALGPDDVVLDIGAGFELGNNALWSVLTRVIAIVLTAAFWAALLLR